MSTCGIRSPRASNGLFMTRNDGRAPTDLRPTTITPGFLPHAEGSVLIEVGRTRTASITGGFVALVLALQRMREMAMIKDVPIVDYVAATSVGIVGGAALLDLAYDEDSKADVDMNFVKTGDGRFIELQGTAEGLPFDRRALDALMRLGHDRS